MGGSQSTQYDPYEPVMKYNENKDQETKPAQFDPYGPMLSEEDIKKAEQYNENKDNYGVLNNPNKTEETKPATQYDPYGPMLSEEDIKKVEEYNENKNNYGVLNTPSTTTAQETSTESGGGLRDTSDADNNKQYGKDKKEARLMMEAIPPNFQGLRELRDRKDPPLDPAIKFDIENFLNSKGERSYPRGGKDQERGSEAAPQTQTPSTTATPSTTPLFPEVPKTDSAKPEKSDSLATQSVTKLPPALTRFQYEQYTDPGVVEAATSTPPSKKTPTKKTPTTSKEQSYLTPYAWRQVKTAAWNLFKYTGLYVAPPIIGRLAYLYAMEQPEGSVLRTGADIFRNLPLSALSAKEKESLLTSLANFQKATSAAKQLFTEAIPNYLTGQGPGQEYGPMLIDPISRLEALERQEFNDTVMADYEKNLRFSIRDRGRGVSKKRRKPSLNMPFRENYETTVGDYATRSAAEVASDLVLTGLQALSPALENFDNVQEIRRRLSSDMISSISNRSRSSIVSNRSVRSNESNLSVTDLFSRAKMNNRRYAEQPPQIFKLTKKLKRQ